MTELPYVPRTAWEPDEWGRPNLVPGRYEWNPDTQQDEYVPDQEHTPWKLQGANLRRGQRNPKDGGPEIPLAPHLASRETTANVFSTPPPSTPSSENQDQERPG